MPTEVELMMEQTESTLLLTSTHFYPRPVFSFYWGSRSHFAREATPHIRATLLVHLLAPLTARWSPGRKLSEETSVCLQK